MYKTQWRLVRENNLAGRIVETNYYSSRILLLNDLNSRIPVTLSSDGAQAILTGSGKKNPKLEYLPEEYEFKEDVNVFASGKERIFIPGTPIGKTTEKGDVKLYVDPNLLLIDGNRFNSYPNIVHKCIIKGDGKYISIAAASIIAKNHRDNIMKGLEIYFYEYDWKNNKGYPTKKHREALMNLGPTEHHRKSFQLLPSQLSLDI